MILQEGKKITIVEGSFKELPKLPVGNWLLKQHPMSGEFSLHRQEDFRMPEKVYGKVGKEVNRYLKTFKRKTSNLGILLRGMKGTGKSLTAKKLCIDSGLPVILVTQAYGGTDFEEFLSSIQQEVIIFIDEFEKVYSSNGGASRDAQDSLLSILDGVFESKKLFLFTANEEYKINGAFMNRPGRIHYLKEYGGLSTKIIDAIIEDTLDNKDYVDELKLCLNYIGLISMDILTSFIWEINIHKDSPKKCLSHLNVAPEKQSFKVTWKEKVESYDKKQKPVIVDMTTYIHYHPLMKGVIDVESYVPFDKVKKYNLNEEYISRRHGLSTCDVNITNEAIEIREKTTKILYTFTRQESASKANYLM